MLVLDYYLELTKFRRRTALTATKSSLRSCEKPCRSALRIFTMKKASSVSRTPVNILRSGTFERFRLTAAAAFLAAAACNPLYADEPSNGIRPDETLATSQLCKDGANAEGVVCVPYFSIQGQSLARQWKIAPPPIDGLPMSEVDPPRDVSADKWQSPFCTDWDDGCTSCLREDSQAAPSCTKFNSIYNYHGCTTHHVFCNKADSSVLN